MKRLAVVLAIAAAGAIAIDLLADATQTRPDPDRPGSRTEVVFRVRVQGGRPPRAAAEGLWGACHGAVERAVVEDLVDAGRGTFRVVVQPALGRHARDRMTGCLEDLTIDNVKGQVVSMEELTAS